MAAGYMDMPYNMAEIVPYVIMDKGQLLQKFWESKNAISMIPVLFGDMRI